MTPPPERLDPSLDASLIDRCLAGEARAWELLVRRHERLVNAVTRRYRLSDVDKQDVFQEVFMALFRGLPKLRDGRALCAWLARTTDRIARATALRSRREGARTEQAPGAVEGIAADAPGGTTALETIEEQALIRQALMALPEGCQRLLVALYYEHPHPSYSQLARRWGVPIGSLGPTRARCIDRLRRILKGLANDNAGIMTGAAPTSRDECTRDEGLDRGRNGSRSRVDNG